MWSWFTGNISDICLRYSSNPKLQFVCHDSKKKKSVNVWKSKEILSMCLRLDQWLNYSCFWGKTRLPEHLDTQESGIFHKCFNLLYLFYAISAWNTNWITDQKSSKHILLFFQDSPGLFWCLIPSVCCWIRRETGQYVVVSLLCFLCLFVCVKSRLKIKCLFLYIKWSSTAVNK